MNSEQIKSMQKQIGILPDGFWGPKSIAACQSYLRSLMPSPHPFPKSDQASLQAFYGSPGDSSQHETINVDGLGIQYDGTPVTKVLVHRRLAASLLSILTDIAKSPHHGILREYAGVYNNRPMRGGSTPSLHARAAAIDLAPDTNGNKMHWPAQSTMPLGVMEIFARHGWLSAGAFWSRDGMHFQGTQ
jgi:hypothetical protein